MADQPNSQIQDQDTMDTQQPEQGIELLDFWAEWCGPCKMMTPIMEEIKKEYAGKLTIRELNVDEEANRELVEKYMVMSIPTYVLLNNGEVIDHFIGAQPKEAITKKLDALLSADKASNNK